MNTRIKKIFLTLFTGALCLASAQAEPVRILFDTDITGDVDDVLALAMLHNLETRGMCTLQCVTISKVNPLTGPFVDAVNTFYGRPDIPIGITREAQKRDSRYLKLATQEDNGKLRFPHDLMRNEDAPEAVEMLRKTLSQQPDHSAVIVQVGLAVNLARLLDSKPDKYSPLPGKELIKQKVKFLSIMAGAFQTIGANNHYHEANVYNDIPSMQKLAKQWPNEVPIIWSGFEIGIAVTYPAASINHDFNYVAHHPVKEAYVLYDPPPHERPCWDLTSVLYAVFPDRGYYDLSPAGKVVVEDDSYTRFFPAKDGKGRDRFLVMNPQQTARVREALVQLVVQPPQAK